MPAPVELRSILELPGVTPKSAFRWTSSLTDPLAPAPLSGAGRAMALAHAEAIRGYLDVENPQHLRYQKQDIDGRSQTFCNVYAHDAARASGAFLPLVWWTPAALLQLEAGIPVVAMQNDTVTALKANALHGWFETHAARFGWSAEENVVRAQERADEGAFVVVMARGGLLPSGKRKAGHIAWIVSEEERTEADPLVRDLDTFVPTLSQAGTNNLRRSTARGRWWKKGYDAVGFWSHPGSP